MTGYSLSRSGHTILELIKWFRIAFTFSLVSQRTHGLKKVTTLFFFHRCFVKFYICEVDLNVCSDLVQDHKEVIPQPGYRGFAKELRIVLKRQQQFIFEFTKSKQEIIFGIDVGCLHPRDLN